MDLKSVISKNVDEYLKPKYPIYRVKYFKAELSFDSEENQELESSYQERICELKENRSDGYIEYFDEYNNYIYEGLLKEMRGRKSWKVTQTDFEHIIVIGLERIA